MGRLDGKRVLATACGQGIGRATALAMARAGAQVFATDIDPGLLDALRADDPGIETFVMDVRDTAAVAEGAARAAPDVLFNCAGFVHAGTVLEATEDEWDFAFDLNVKSMFRTTRAVLPGMLERGGGSIVNMSSAASSIIGAPNRCVYGATKAAVIGLTKATGDYETALAAFIARQKMGRIGTPEEIAALAVYLASDESAFTTGQTHVIDGGWSG